MGDVKEILSAVLSDEKLLNSKAFRDKVYTDEPIIRTAAQLKSSSVPAKIKEMKSLAYTPEAYWKTSAWLFRTQGKFMEDFSDNFECSDDFSSLYPTYRDLTTEQLRGYFTWRSKIRKGESPNAPMPFILIYMYELINCIGVASPEEGLMKLKAIAEAYGSSYSDVLRYSSRWMTDMAAYYEIPAVLLSDSPEQLYESCILILAEWESHSEDELFDAIMKLSAYTIDKSSFYIEEPDTFKKAACRVFSKLSEYFRLHRKNTLCENYFGRLTETKYRIFEAAVFFDCDPLKDRDYTINPLHHLSCRKGVWYCEKLHGSRGKSKELGELMRSVDSILREQTGKRHKFSQGEVSKITLSLAEREITTLLSEIRRSEPVRIDIDLSALDNIRHAADITRDKLIVEEEDNDIFPVNEAVSEPEEKAETAPDNTGNSPLNEGEAAFLRTLLLGGDWKSAAAGNGFLPSVLCDSINEKLFDTFGDTVIDSSDDFPVIIEDYADDLKNMLNIS